MSDLGGCPEQFLGTLSQPIQAWKGSKGQNAEMGRVVENSPLLAPNLEIASSPKESSS